MRVETTAIHRVERAPSPSFCIPLSSLSMLRGWNPGRHTPKIPPALACSDSVNCSWHTILPCRCAKFINLKLMSQLFPAIWNHPMGIHAYAVINWVNYKRKQNLALLSLTYCFISSTRGFRVWIVCVNRPSLSLQFLYGDNSNYGQHYCCPQSLFGFEKINIS